MDHIELPSPFPRETDLPYERVRYSVTDRIYLPPPHDTTDVQVWPTLLSRETRRTFGPVSLSVLATLLWFTAKTKRSQRVAGTTVWESKPTPSAGGLNPIDLLVVDTNETPRRVCVYDSLSHSLGVLSKVTPNALIALLDLTNDIVPFGQGTVIWFAPQFGRTAARYVGGESLVWRDAGALLAMIYIAAEALGLSCSGIGATGDPIIEELIGDKKVCGVGGCIIGSRCDV